MKENNPFRPQLRTQAQSAYEQLPSAVIGLVQHQFLVSEFITQKFTEILLRLESISNKVDSISDVVSECSPKERIQDGNVGQAHDHANESLTNKVDSIARLLGRLGPEAMASQIHQVLSQLRHPYSEICQLTKHKDDVFAGILTEIEKIFDDHGARLIHPGHGDDFDPKSHTPISSKPTTTKSLVGRISTTFLIGLETDQQIIQPARVGLYTQKPKTLKVSNNE